MATAAVAVRGVAPTTRSSATAEIPTPAAAVERRIPVVRAGAAFSSNRERATATAAVSASAVTSQRGRPSHHRPLPGVGSTIACASARIEDAPAMASSTGMCQR
jgi:hypothetical protein